MGDNAHERFNHRKDEQTSRMNEVISELESRNEHKRGTAIASGRVTLGSQDLTTAEMMQASDQFDVEVPEEDSGNGYMLNDQEAVEALDESYNTITNVLDSQSWSSLETSPLYDDGFVSHLGNLREHFSNHVSDQEEVVISAPEDEADELVYEFEGRDYVVSVPESEAYDPAEDIRHTLGALTTREEEQTAARLKMLDMYAQGADIQETAAELGNSFENIYEADDELREAGLVDSEGLTDKGMHIYGTVVAQYEELEG